MIKIQIILPLLLGAAFAQTPVQIQSVATRIDNVYANSGGSLMGGTVLYIKALGLDPTPSKNYVRIGNNPAVACSISDKGVNGIDLACSTIAALSQDLTDQQVYLTVNKNPEITCATCKFSFLASRTPKLQNIVPRTVQPNEEIQWQAQFIVNTYDEIQDQIIGDVRCSRFDLVKSDPSDRLTTSYVNCHVAPVQTAGYNNVVLRTDSGYSQNERRITSYSVVNKDTDGNPIQYQVISLAKISGIGGSYASTQGKQFTILGSGFPTQASDVQVFVAGQKAQVLSSSNSQIQVQSPIFNSNHNANVTNNFNQYIGGGGLRWTLYDLSKQFPSDCNAFRVKVTNDSNYYPIIQEGIRGEPIVTNTFGSFYGQFYRGYFKAVATGDYRFYLSTDDCSSLWINLNPKDSNRANMVQIAQMGCCSGELNYFYYQTIYSSTNNQISPKVTLTAGEYYYIEMFHVQGGGDGYFSVAVEIPNNSVRPDNFQEIQKLTISYTPDYEIFQYSIYNTQDNNPLSGTYQLKFSAVDGATRTVLLDATTDPISATANVNTISSQLAYKASIQSTVTQVKLDKSGNPLSDQTSTTFAGYQYIITVKQYRASNIRVLPRILTSGLYNGIVGQSVYTVQEPSSQISGYYQLSFNGSLIKYGQSTNFPITAQPWDIGLAISWAIGIPTSAWFVGICTDGCIIYLRFFTPGNIPDISISGSGLTGGKIGSSPYAFAGVYLSGSTNIFLDPIPGEILFTAHDTPQVQVVANGVYSTCQDSTCNLIVSDAYTPTLSSFSFSASLGVLSLTISDPRTNKFTSDDLTIQFAGQTCTNIKYDKTTVTCSVNKNLQAGSWIPQVHIESIGYCKVSPNVTPLGQDITITSVTPTKTSTYGGPQMTIIGTGFPNDLKQWNQYNISIGDQLINQKNVLSVSPTQLVFTVPAEGAGSTILIQSGSKQTTSNAFTYDESLRIRVTALSASSSSPIKKVPIKITGNNFGSNKTALSVFLYGIANTYQLNILNVTQGSNGAPDQLWAFLGGGKTGTYNLTVIRSGYGRSQPATANANVFQYAVLVKSISPTSGSTAGGTIITITGENFTPGSNQVFIGSAINWICNIISETATQITCITPPKFTTSEYDSAVDVVVTANIVDESTCAGSCKFTYDAAITPVQNTPADALNEPVVIRGYTPIQNARRLLLGNNINPHRRFLWEKDTDNDNHPKFFIGLPKRRQLVNTLAQDPTPPTKYKVYSTNDSITIDGQLFGDSPSVVIGLYGLVSSFTSKSTTQLQFYFPSLPAGNHSLQVVHNTYGYANGNWNAHVLLKLVSVSPTIGSRGGQLLTINGGGFNTLANINDAQKTGEKRAFPTVTVGGKPCTNVNVISSERLTCVSPSISADGAQAIVVSQINPTTFGQDSALGISFTTQTSSTPFVNNQQSTSSGGNIRVTVQGNLLDNPVNPQVYLIGDGESISGTIVSQAPNQIVADFTKVPGGNFNLRITYNNSNVYAQFDQTWRSQVLQPTVSFKSNDVQSSIQGGGSVTLTGSGFSTNKTNNIPYVCGAPCMVMSSSYSQITCMAPQLTTATTLQSYKANSPVSVINLNNFDVTYDQQMWGQSPITDGDQSTMYYSNSTDCYMMVDFGSLVRLRLKQFNFMPHIGAQASQLQNGTFSYSSDNVTYTTFLTIDGSVHAGWNYFGLDDGSEISNIRYLKYTGISSTSQCRLAELQVKGWLLYKNDLNPSNAACPVTLKVNRIEANGYGTVYYKSSLTPNVTAVSPPYGKSPGGTTLTITGKGFGTNKAKVKVTASGVDCQVSTVSDTSITCVTGSYDDYQSNKQSMAMSNSQDFQVVVDGQVANLKTDGFFYANSWSDDAVWGGDIPPRDGDVVVIPQGQTLMVDIAKTPKLYSVLVEGTLLFKEGLDIDFYSGHILIMMGTLQIGTYDKPRQSKLKIQLHGNLYDDVQLPDFGSKFIGCHMCTLDIHGVKRSKTWTVLAKTAEVGDSVIQLMETVDWQQNEEIVIASTNWDHAQSEVFKIKATTTSNGKTTLTLNDTISYRHYSAIEVYGNEKFPMQAEVGLLTRNILIRGDPADSINSLYGAHLMIHGTGLGGAIGRISYAEFTNVGQPMIIGRYPIHFHLNGPMMDSFVEGNAVHHSHARIVTIHGTHFLRVFKNVGYENLGHAVFLEDGIEQYNDIHDNLILGNRQSWIMLQTDITTASYWITNPNNYLYNNRAGGSEWYGYWYQIKDHPDGASATDDICPPGLPLGQFENNTAHSNGRFGLRILKMAALTQPCRSARSNDVDPFAKNPSIQSVFKNFITFANFESGVLGEQLGNIMFQDVKTADNKRAGFDSYLTNLTYEGAYLQNWLIVGQSQGNSANQANDFFNGSNGIITPRTSNLRVSNVRFWNFRAGMNLLQACSLCDNLELVISTSKTSFFKKLSVKNSSNFQWVFWNGMRRDIFWDEDGSITNTSGGGYITPYKVQLDGIQGCQAIRYQPQWNDSIICDGNATVRGVLINAPQPTGSFSGANLKIYRMASPTENLTLANSTSFQDELWVKMMRSNDIKEGWSSQLAAGYYYNVHWKQGIDWSNVAVQPSEFFSASDPGYVLRFNYSSSRELYDITKLAAGTVFNYTQIGYTLNNFPDPANCFQGENYHDIDNKAVFVCFSGRNRTNDWEYVNINPVICRFNCPGAPGTEPKIEGLWSNAEIWPSGSVPTGDEPLIYIPSNLSIVVDVKTPALQSLIVDGQLSFAKPNNSDALQTGDRFLQDQDQNSTSEEIVLRAKYIWIRNGSLTLGSPNVPYTGKAAIELQGQQGDDALIIDPFIDASSKVLAVTGTLNIYAQAPASVWTRLGAFASAGDTEITVLSAEGWSVGDEIVIAPSGRVPQQHEKRTITNINGSVITLNSALTFNHFGAQEITIDKPGIGQLDMRTPVGHLTRSFQIRGSEGDWGGRLLVYQTGSGDTLEKGSVNLYGVEFINMGQRDTENAGLDFRYTNDPNVRKTSVVKGCSFHESKGYLLHADFAYDLKINYNVFYYGVKKLVRMVNGVNNQFTDNLMVYMQTRQRSRPAQESGVIGDFTPPTDVEGYDFTIANTLISGNVAVGSESHGLFVADVPCGQESEIGIFNNTASSVVLIAIAFRMTSHSCSVVRDHYAYHSSRGLMVSQVTHSINVKNVIGAENDISLVMKGGQHDHYNNSYHAENIYITALARPNCTKCYSWDLGAPCRNGLGMQIGAVSSIAFPPFQSKPSVSFDVICTIQMMNGQNYLKNIVFENFNLTYNKSLPTCNDNRVFRQHHGAVDTNMAHYMKNVTCRNCDDGAKFDFIDAPASEIGWFGGCGSFECTGKWNVLMSDVDGSFLGAPGVAISNNSWYGPNATNCVRVKAWNGYRCPITTSLIYFLSIAPDFNTRLYSPVQLTDGVFWNEINSFKEWNWEGPEPLNTRESKFVGLITLNTTINMINAGQNPSDSQYFLSRKNSVYGAPEDWVIIKMKYQTSHTIQVLTGMLGSDQVVDSFVGPNAVDLSKYVNRCGANNYFPFNNTIHFVVTGDPACIVRVRQMNSVMITMRFSIDYDKFFSNSNNLDNFNKIYYAFLSTRGGIDTSKVKTVGYARGSVIRQDALIAGSATDMEDTEQLNNLTAVAKDLQTEMGSSSGQFAGLGYSLQVTAITPTKPINTSEINSTEAKTFVQPVKKPISTSSKSVSFASTSSSSSESESVNTTGIIVGVVLGVFFLSAIIAGAACFLKKSDKVHQKVATQEDLDVTKQQQTQNSPNGNNTKNFVQHVESELR